MAKLVAVRGPTRGRVYPLQGACILGRSPNCQIYVGDLTVSRQHARIVLDETGFVVEDLGSENGTYVNEERVEKRRLSPADEIRISSSVFRFVPDAESGDERKWVSMLTVDSSQDLDDITYADSKPSIPTPLEFLGEDQLRQDLARTLRLLETFYAVSAATSSILEPQTLFDKILDSLFHIFTNADRGFIMLRDEAHPDQLIPKAIRRRKGVGFTGELSISQTVVSRVMEEGQSVLSTAGRAALAASAGVSRMCAPLVVRGETLGILHIEGRSGGKPFTQEDLDLLSGTARQAAVAILNASMHKKLLKQQRLEQDLALARQVQQSFLPTHLPNSPGIRFDRQYRPFHEVGGDFYDFIALPQGQIGVLIGDVSGKGITAALLMARLTSQIRSYASFEHSPARVMAHANQALLENTQDNMFATVLYLTIDPAQNALTICNAGHIPPHLLFNSHRDVRVVDGATNVALGVVADASFDESRINLELGDCLLLCTDGVIEAKNQAGEEFGFDRLAQTLRDTRKSDPLGTLFKEIEQFSGESLQADDITVVTLTRES
jgi:serine phosphatase RsbU (regulator of sigma subunit)/pSer/pThr/pTyr-binding forkhead associated (FHA) protein